MFWSIKQGAQRTNVHARSLKKSIGGLLASKVGNDDDAHLNRSSKKIPRQIKKHEPVTFADFKGSLEDVKPIGHATILELRTKSDDVPGQNNFHFEKKTP